MRPSVGRRTSAASASAIAVLFAGAAIILAHDLLSYDLGPQARHMILHIVAMNIVAPLLAALVVRRWPAAACAAPPALVRRAHPGRGAVGIARAGGSSPRHGPGPVLNSQPTAFCCWRRCRSGTRFSRCRMPDGGMPSRPFCFRARSCAFSRSFSSSPRGRSMATIPLFMPDTPARLADQQIAGLLMIAACPLSYLLAAIIITVQLINQKFGAPPRTDRWAGAYSQMHLAPIRLRAALFASHLLLGVFFCQFTRDARIPLRLVRPLLGRGEPRALANDGMVPDLRDAQLGQDARLRHRGAATGQRRPRHARRRAFP